jgi:hypothetical protein
VLRPPTPTDGWGLHLVDARADHWEIEDGSAHVWFEVALPE